jgi:hypothetical protein
MARSATFRSAKPHKTCAMPTWLGLPFIGATALRSLRGGGQTHGEGRSGRPGVLEFL